MRKEVSLKNLFDQSLAIKILQKIGVQDEKLSYSLKAYHAKFLPKEINYNKSYHCSKMQTSKVIIIEHKQEDLNLEDHLYKTETRVREGDGELNFKFLKEK